VLRKRKKRTKSERLKYNILIHHISVILSLSWTLLYLGPCVPCTRILQRLSRLMYSPYPGPSFALLLCTSIFTLQPLPRILNSPHPEPLLYLGPCVTSIRNLRPLSRLLYSPYSGPSVALGLLLHALAHYSTVKPLSRLFYSPYSGLFYAWACVTCPQTRSLFPESGTLLILDPPLQWACVSSIDTLQPLFKLLYSPFAGFSYAWALC
jgi:hypothetical protein